MFFGMWGEIAGVLAGLSAALSSLQVRALGAGARPFVINAMRCWLAALLFALIWWFGSRATGDWTSALPLLLVAVACGLVLGDSLYFAAIARIGSARATPVAMSYPLPTAFLATMIFSEELSALKFVGIICGVAAIWIIAARSRDVRERAGNVRDYWTGVVFAIAASLCWAISVLALRPALEKVPLDFANLLRMVMAALLLLVVAYPATGKMTVSAGPFRFAGLIAGLALTAVGTSYFLTASIHHSGAAVASILSSMAPVFAAPLAWFIFGEEITTRVVVAIMLGLLGIAIVVIY